MRYNPFDLRSESFTPSILIAYSIVWGEFKQTSEVSCALWKIKYTKVFTVGSTKGIKIEGGIIIDHKTNISIIPIFVKLTVA